jgi:hypothetical protein
MSRPTRDRAKGDDRAVDAGVKEVTAVVRRTLSRNA